MTGKNLMVEQTRLLRQLLPESCIAKMPFLRQEIRIIQHLPKPLTAFL